jgi:hypothetical protein
MRERVCGSLIASLPMADKPATFFALNIAGYKPLNE